MHATAETLWRLNREYVNRLVKARNYLGLLEHMVLTRGAAEIQAQLLPTLQFARAHLSRLSEAHRRWCYVYFYESAETRCMVQSAQEVRRALTGFVQMREQHGILFNDLAARLNALPRPESDITHVPNGDLWEMAQGALSDLASLDASLEL